MKKISKSPINTIKQKGFVKVPYAGLDASGQPFVMGYKIWKEITELEWKNIMKKIKVPVKIIQAQKDGEPFIGFNREAFRHIKSDKKFELVSGADHIFRGKRVQLYKLTLDWFDRFL